MMWIWIVLAFLGGAVAGIAFGRSARFVAYTEGHINGFKSGWHAGWDDHKWHTDNPVEDEK